MTVAAGAALMFAGAAQAYTLDQATGTGFAGVSFSYEATDTYSAVCTWVTGEGTKGEKTHDVTHGTSTSVSSVVSYDPRVRTQITGFTLTGFGLATTTGTVPVVGEDCQGEGAEGTWSAVTPTGSTGGLYAYFGTSSALLTPTVPVV